MLVFSISSLLLCNRYCRYDLVIILISLGVLGATAYVAGFAPIAAGSLAAGAMSAAWTTGIGGGIVSTLQSGAALFANCLGATVAPTP